MKLQVLVHYTKLLKARDQFIKESNLNYAYLMRISRVRPTDFFKVIGIESLPQTLTLWLPYLCTSMS